MAIVFHGICRSLLGLSEMVLINVFGICSFKNIAQSRFRAKVFVCK